MPYLVGVLPGVPVFWVGVESSAIMVMAFNIGSTVVGFFFGRGIFLFRGVVFLLVRVDLLP